VKFWKLEKEYINGSDELCIVFGKYKCDLVVAVCSVHFL